MVRGLKILKYCGKRIAGLAAETGRGTGDIGYESEAHEIDKVKCPAVLRKRADIHRSGLRADNRVYPVIDGKQVQVPGK